MEKWTPFSGINHFNWLFFLISTLYINITYYSIIVKLNGIICWWKGYKLFWINRNNKELFNIYVWKCWTLRHSLVFNVRWWKVDIAYKFFIINRLSEARSSVFQHAWKYFPREFNVIYLIQRTLDSIYVL